MTTPYYAMQRSLALALDVMPLTSRIFPFAVVVLLTGCTEYDGKVSLDNLTQLTRVTLRAPNPNSAIVGITIAARGRINGMGRVFLILNGKPYQSEELEGRIHFRWGGDWYSPAAVVQYEPLDASGGQIDLRYDFREL